MTASTALFADDAFEGKVALITGGGTGLGRASAAELVAGGGQVVIAGRREEILAATAEALGERCIYVSGDVRDESDARRIVATALERHGRLDVLVNNAGGQYFAPAEMVEYKGWNAVMRLNVGGTLRMSNAAYQLAFKKSGGTILNVTLSPHHGMPGMVHSATARATVEGLTRELAAAWAGNGVTVIAIAPGHFNTEVLAKYPEIVQKGASKLPPLQRLGEPHEHAWLVAFCCTEAGRALSGSVVTLDGARDNFTGPWPTESWSDDSGEVPVEARRATP